MVSGRPDLIIPCECGAGNCTVGPLIYNQQCLFICCPKGLANGGGCGFMQWRDPNKTTTWHSHDNLPHPPPLFTTTVAIAEEYTPPFTAAKEDTPPPPPMTVSQVAPPPPPPMTVSEDAPPPPPPQTVMMCPCCGAGSCSIGTAKNGHNFYSCSSCKFKKWCDAGSSSQCYICREEGHWHMDCPQLPPPQTTTMICPCCAGSCSIGIAKNARYFYSCSSCKFRKWCNAGSSSQCYICREEGHWHMDCPRLPPTAATNAAKNNKIICFYCKLEGHYVAQCPSKSRRRRN